MSTVHATHIVNEDWALLAVSSMRSLGLHQDVAERLPQNPKGSVKELLENMTIRGLLTKDRGVYRVCSL